MIDRTDPQWLTKTLRESEIALAESVDSVRAIRNKLEAWARLAKEYAQQPNHQPNRQSDYRPDRTEIEHPTTALADLRSTEAEAHIILNSRVHCVDQEFPLLMRIRGLVDYYNKLGEHVESLTVERDRLRSRLERARAALQEIADADQELDPSGRSDADCMRDLARRTLAALREFDAAGDRTGERDGYTPEMFREARRRHAEEQADAWSEDGGKDE